MLPQLPKDHVNSDVEVEGGEEREEEKEEQRVRRKRSEKDVQSSLSLYFTRLECRYFTASFEFDVSTTNPHCKQTSFLSIKASPQSSVLTWYLPKHI